MESIRVFIVDDHPLMRSALEMAIEAARDMQAAGEAPTGAEALELIPLIEPDVVLMDLMMPEVTGLAAIRALMSMLPNVRILVLTSLDKERDIIEAVRAGAHGYITKNAQRDELLEAIRTVHSGEAYLPTAIAAKLMDSFRSKNGEKERSVNLTDRQKEVLELIGQGYSNAHIAEALCIAEGTVRVHITHMMDILGFEHRRELVVYAVKQNMDG